LLSFSVFYLRCIVARHTIIKVSFTIKITERVFGQVRIPPVLKVYYFLCSTYIFSLFFRKVENQVGTYCPNGYMIVFAVDDEDSLDEAEKTLSYLKKEEILQHQAVILVANKTDLVRSRLISTSNGKSLAMKYGVKYIETSPGINHNVDELLVGMLTQIRLREHENERNGSSTSSAKTKGFKVLGLFEKMWNGKDSKSKSCNNLHVL